MGAYAPTTIASSSIPVKRAYTDWSEALTWMHHNIPDDAIVASWWDYGYWIYVVSNKTTLADNGTLNTTQIAQIGKMFLSNETQAVEILKTYNVSYVVVFTTIKQGLAYGDEVKWGWMALIAGLNKDSLTDYDLTKQTGLPFPNRDLVLTKLIFYGTGYYHAYNIAEPVHFELVFRSSNQMVLVYKVKY